MKLITASMVLLLVLTLSPGAKAQQRDMSLENRHLLINMFLEKGFERSFLQEVFYNKRLIRLPIVVNRNIHNKENRRNYEDFYSPYSMKVAQRFSKKWRTLLSRAGEKFGVDKEVLVAILLVETGLGNVLGQYPVISVFSSILVEHNAKQVFSGDAADLSEDEQYVLDRLSLKASWAEVELSALLEIAKTTQSNPYRYKGSFAGAFGIPQFLPSSYLKWGYDSDNNGSVNLFYFPDAIYSTANYLKAHGWKKGLYLESNKDVIYKYNRSEVYVETVLNVAKKIRRYNTLKNRQKSDQTRLVEEKRDPNKETTS